MKKIDLKEVIEATGVDSLDLARVLFPSNKYPQVALERVMRGESELNATQIYNLSDHTGLEINDLFTEVK